MVIIKNILNKFERDSQIVMPGFQIDEVSITLMKFFSEERFETWKSLTIEPNKGIILAGPKGIGKTVNFKIISKVISKESNAIGYPRVISTKEIQSTYKLRQETGSGEEYLREIVNIPCLIIDDLGNEDFRYMDYGTPRNLIADILSLRYILFQRGLCTTHATTNLNHKLIEENYEPRLVDRMREMFVFQSVRGASKRENPIKVIEQSPKAVEYTEVEKRMIYLEWYKTGCFEPITDLNGVMWKFFERNNIELPGYTQQEYIQASRKKVADFIDLTPKQDEDLRKHLQMRNFFQANPDFDFTKHEIL